MWFKQEEEEEEEGEKEGRRVRAVKGWREGDREEEEHAPPLGFYQLLFYRISNQASKTGFHSGILSIFSLRRSTVIDLDFDLDLGLSVACRKSLRRSFESPHKH